ncbi:MAG: hypothetical protein WCX65_16330 [bacterium]
MAEIESASAAQNVYLAAPMYKQATWIRVMAEAFKEIDSQRAQLDANGPWTVRTRSLQEYSRFSTYA